MTAEDIRAAADSVAVQVAASMRGLAAKLPSESIYAVALVVSDDFATAYKAFNTESHHRASVGGPVRRWQPTEWFENGMGLEVEVLFERLGDPTFQVDPEMEKRRPNHQAAWLVALFEGLRLARMDGRLHWGRTPVFAFCTVQDSGLAAWSALESARLVNPPELLTRYEAELIEAWAGWESDDQADAVQSAYATLRNSLR